MRIKFVFMVESYDHKSVIIPYFVIFPHISNGWI